MTFDLTTQAAVWRAPGAAVMSEAPVARCKCRSLSQFRKCVYGCPADAMVQFCRKQAGAADPICLPLPNPLPLLFEQLVVNND